jgi:peptide/nickel transport system permease protein
MTAIIRNRDFTAPPIARAGLAVPGLGHLLLKEWSVGLGLMSLFGLWGWSALAGFPRLGAVLFSAPGDNLSIHSVLSVVSWVAIGVSLYGVAYRRAWPRVQSEEEYNSNRSIFLRNLRAHRTGMFGLFGVLFLAVATLLTPLIAPYDPVAIDMGPQNAPPSWMYLFGFERSELLAASGTWTYLMGTDHFGRDVFSRVLFGGRISLTIGLVAVFIAATIGTTAGAVAAWFGGWIDRGIMWFTDLLLALPRLVLLLTVVGMFRVQGTKGIWLIIVILGLTAWMGIARIVRSQVLSLKRQEFIAAAEALGLSNGRILFRHLIPNAMAPVIVFCSLAIGSTMLAEAGLSFLGLGVPPPTSTWGVMVNDGRGPLRLAPWIATFPGLAIVIAVMSFNLLGDGLRDALDPKLRK